MNPNNRNLPSRLGRVLWHALAHLARKAIEPIGSHDGRNDDGQDIYGAVPVRGGTVRAPRTAATRVRLSLPAMCALDRSCGGRDRRQTRKLPARLRSRRVDLVSLVQSCRTRVLHNLRLKPVLAAIQWGSYRRIGRLDRSSDRTDDGCSHLHGGEIRLLCYRGWHACIPGQRRSCRPGTGRCAPRFRAIIANRGPGRFVRR